MVFDIVVSPAWQITTNLAPFITELLVISEHLVFFVECPRILIDGRI